MEDLFEMKEELARGLQGVVRLCTHRTMGHDFACKSTFFEEPASSAARLALAEVNALAAVSTHPNIVDLFAHFEQPSAIHVILELCRGGNLFHHLSQRQTELMSSTHSWHHAEGPHNTHTDCRPAASRQHHESSMSQECFVDPLTHWPLSEFEAAQIFAAALRAVSYCHDHGFMHGDIKLENLLLPTEACSYDEIKLSDFGFASRFYIAKLGRTAVQGRQGTLPYMAPETINSVDESNYDEKADIWSLGVLLYLLLCGEFPFQGKESEDVLNAMSILKSPNWEQISIVSPNASSLARDLLKRMLHLNPLKRYCAKSLLTHPWLQYYGLAGQVPISRESEYLRERLLQSHQEIRGTKFLHQSHGDSQRMNSSQEPQHPIEAN